MRASPTSRRETAAGRRRPRPERETRRYTWFGSLVARLICAFPPRSSKTHVSRGRPSESVVSPRRVSRSAKPSLVGIAELAEFRGSQWISILSIPDILRPVSVRALAASVARPLPIQSTRIQYAISNAPAPTLVWSPAPPITSDSSRLKMPNTKSRAPRKSERTEGRITGSSRSMSGVGLCPQWPASGRGVEPSGTIRLLAKTPRPDNPCAY
jgi:hypothetical protein